MCSAHLIFLGPLMPHHTHHITSESGEMAWPKGKRGLAHDRLLCFSSAPHHQQPLGSPFILMPKIGQPATALRKLSGGERSREARSVQLNSKAYHPSAFCLPCRLRLERGHQKWVASGHGIQCGESYVHSSLQTATYGLRPQQCVKRCRMMAF